MALKPEISIMAALATAGIVVAVRQSFTPPTADIQGMPAGQPDIEAAGKRALWTSIGIVSIVSLLAKDPAIFTVGGLTAAGLELHDQYANWTETLSMGGRPMTPSEQLSEGSAYDGPAAPAESLGAYEMFEDSELV